MWAGGVAANSGAPCANSCATAGTEEGDRGEWAGGEEYLQVNPISCMRNDIFLMTSIEMRESPSFSSEPSRNDCAWRGNTGRSGGCREQGGGIVVAG